MPMKISWTSRRRPTRPLIRYSLCPERYRRRPTTISPGRDAMAGFSGARLFQCLRLTAVSSTRISSVEASVRLSTVPGDASRASTGASAAGSGCPSSTFATASESSGSTRVRVTSEMPMGGRLAVPLKMQSDMRSARSILWLCSPSTHEIASTTLDLPHPFGPTMHVIPLPLNVIGVFSQNDLKPRSSTLRSFSTRPSHGSLPMRHPQKEVQFDFSLEVYRDKNVRRVDMNGPAAWRFQFGGYANRN